MTQTAFQQSFRYRKPSQYRPGFTLVELLVTIVATSVLMAALMSCILIAGHALDEDRIVSARQLQAGKSLDHVLVNLRDAMSFSERTANAVTFQVPDRTGDELPETIRYSWSGTAGDPLRMEYNGSAPETLVADVNQFNLSYSIRTMTGTGFAKGILTPPPNFETFAEAKRPNPFFSTLLPSPPGLVEGDLLIAAIAVSNPDADVTAPVGWNLIYINKLSSNTGCLAVFWKNAMTGEPPEYDFSWSTEFSASSYSWIMRFSGHNPSAPIHTFSAAMGNSKTPASPSVLTSIENTLILRIGAFAAADITLDAPGLPDHDPITMDQATTSDIAGGTGYRVQVASGESGTSAFSLVKRTTYLTVTIALAPEE